MKIKRLINLAKRVKQQGFVLTIRIAFDRIGLGLLQRFYGFNSWHVEAPLSARPYRGVVANMVNDLNPKHVVEVGCGLGAILSLIHAQSRYGYDLDDGAIRAARLLRSRKIIFSTGSLDDVELNNIDVLILVNWIHEVSPRQLQSWLFPLLPHTHFLLLDAIDQDNSLDYRYKHDFSFLSDRAVLIREVRPEREGRRFMLYKVTP